MFRSFHFPILSVTRAAPAHTYCQDGVRSVEPGAGCAHATAISSRRYCARGSVFGLSRAHGGGVRAASNRTRQSKTAKITDFYRFGGPLGKGGFGEVKVGTDIASGKEYAVKLLSKLKFANLTDRCVPRHRRR